MSIRLRLALWYGGLTGLVLLGISVAFDAAHSRTHYDDLDRALRTAAEEMAEEYGRDPSVTVLPAVTPGMVVVVYAPDGQVVAAPRNAEALPPVDPRTVPARAAWPPFDPLAGLAPPLVPSGPSPGVFGLIDDPDRGRWRLYVAPIAGGGDVVAAAPLGWIDASIEGLRRLTLLAAFAGAALTFLGGWLLATRALRPVAALTETAGAIARAREPGRRVPAGSPHDELGLLAATVNEVLESLEEAYRAQQRFVAAASHELRAPLTVIRANLELLRRHGSVPDLERQEALAEVGREVDRLIRLVADLLTLARADADVPLRRERLELDRLVLEVVREARHLASGQLLEVERLEPASVEGGPDRLKQLLLILVDNAIKYTPAEGRITVGLWRDGPVAEVRVRDTGVGIPPEELPRVFERFYRASPGQVRDPGGTGLGLPIARWIAEKHAGDVSLTSELGHGTTARIRLPLVG